MVLHGGMMDAENAYLQIGNRTNPHVTMVSVIIPRAVWVQLSSAGPDTWIGRTVEVEASPQLVDGKYLNLAIAEATQLRAIEAR